MSPTTSTLHHWHSFHVNVAWSLIRPPCWARQFRAGDLPSRRTEESKLWPWNRGLQFRSPEAGSRSVWGQMSIQLSRSWGQCHVFPPKGRALILLELLLSAFPRKRTKSRRAVILPLPTRPGHLLRGLRLVLFWTPWSCTQLPGPGQPLHSGAP